MLLPHYAGTVELKSIRFADLIRRPTTWLWLVWCVGLASCFIGQLYIMAVYPSVPSHPPPWTGPVESIQGLIAAQYWVSLVAAVAPLVWERRWYIVLATWILAATIYGAVQILGFCNMLGKTGAYL